MKIFAIINNYGTQETQPAETSTDLDWYDLPDSTLLRSGNPFFIPDLGEEYEAYPSIAIRIGRLGKSIASRFAYRYIDGIGPGVAVMAKGLLAKLRDEGAPWTRATAFDRSLWLGNLQGPDTLSKLDEIEFACGDRTITYRLSSLRTDIAGVIEKVSAYNTLKNGDLILAGLAAEGIKLRPETRMTARIDTESNLLDIKIK